MLKPGDTAYHAGASGATNECQVSAIAWNEKRVFILFQFHKVIYSDFYILKA